MMKALLLLLCLVVPAFLAANTPDSKDLLQAETVERDLPYARRRYHRYNTDPEAEFVVASRGKSTGPSRGDLVSKECRQYDFLDHHDADFGRDKAFPAERSQRRGRRRWRRGGKKWGKKGKGKGKGGKSGRRYNGELYGGKSGGKSAGKSAGKSGKRGYYPESERGYRPRAVYRRYGKGRGKSGGIYGRRELQFSGENCDRNILTVAKEKGLSTFVMLVEAAGLTYIFDCPGPFTAWIPSNEAFAALDPTYVQNLMKNPTRLREFLLYHLLPGFQLSTQMKEGPVQTLQGSSVNIAFSPFRINQAVVTTSDILACNGVIDIIDDVLVPPGARKYPTLCLQAFRIFCSLTSFPFFFPKQLLPLVSRLSPLLRLLLVQVL